jgi:hypothetical protein
MLVDKGKQQIGDNHGQEQAEQKQQQDLGGAF